MPFSYWLMQHEAAIGLHRAAKVDRNVVQFVRLQLEIDALEQRLQAQVDGAVDYHA